MAASALGGWRNVRYVRNPVVLLEALARRGEKVVVFRIGPRRFALVVDAEAAVAVLRGSPAGLGERSRFYREIERVVGQASLVTVSGDEHARLRGLLAPLFDAGRVDSFREEMRACADAVQAGWREGEEIDVGSEMSRLTLRIVGRTLLAVDGEREAAELLELLDVGTRLFYRVFLPAWLSELLWRQAWLPGNRRLLRAQRRLDVRVRRIIEERRRVAADGGDLVSAMLSAGLSDEELRDQIVTFLLAGHETTAQALTWAWYLLSVHPDAEQRLHREVDSCSSLDPSALPYTRAVVRETLRLYPPAWFLTRETVAPTTIANTSLPQGTMVIVSPWVLHRDPRHWPEPARFLPERWLDGAPQPFAYAPFGRGRRSCIGGSFATVEALTALATIARRWRLRSADTRPAIPHATITLRPRRGIRLILERRP